MQKADTDQDVLHHDIPFFQMDLEGNFYYQDKVLWEAQSPCKKAIKDSIERADTLKIPTNFVEWFKKARIIQDES